MVPLHALVLVALTASPALAQATAPPASDAPRNVVVLIADGFGPASVTLARTFAGAPLAMDEILVGSIATHASDTHITDSAAAGTALACGVKTTNGAIAVKPDGAPVRTVLEAAEERGLATGLVVTSRITHATPACFSAHVRNRGHESDIAAQQLAQGIELLLGGGRDFFVPTEAGGRRRDARNLLAEADAAGYRVLETRADFDALDALPALGLFGPDHLPYEIDRAPELCPSLTEMTRKALALLARDPDGFLLMVEGSRIDHAGHQNDPVGHVHDILAYDDALAVVLDFARTDGRTLVVSTSDHETGGLTLGRESPTGIPSDWKPEVLARAKASSDGVWDAVAAGKPVADALRELAGLGELSAEELAPLLAAKEQNDSRVFRDGLNRLVSERAVIGWSTYDHTSVDVLLYATGPGSARFRGHHDNTAVARIVAELMGFELSGK